MPYSLQAVEKLSLTDSPEPQAGDDQPHVCPAEKHGGGQPLYTLLDEHKDEIRIIRLTPGSWDEPIICTAFCARIEDRPAYTALSYVWGDPADTREVRLDGHSVLVTRNLFAALRRLRDPERVKHLWVDALCINQADDEEKSRQASLMRHIYSNSTDAVIWLGEYLDVDLEPPTKAEWGDSSGIRQSLMPEVNVREAFDMIERSVEHEYAIFEDLLRLTQYRDTSCMMMLQELPWWTRIWTLQVQVNTPQAVYSNN